MKRETITQALGGLDDRFVSEAAVYAPGTMQEGPERIVRMKKKRFLSIVLAAALILALGITAYAAWSTHAARQEEIKADLKIEENNVSSYAAPRRQPTARSPTFRKRKDRKVSLSCSPP